MRFIGQEHIFKELNAIIPLAQDGKNFNILFKGPSGYGKTTLAIMISLLIDRRFTFLIPNEGKLKLDLSKRVIFIDEIHTLKDPEFLYPYLDSGKYTFLLASNESGKLKEPLVNRCINFIFREYTKNEMRELILQILGGYFLNNEYIDYILQNTSLNPRICKNTCTRLINLFTYYGIPKNFEELKWMIQEVLQIKEGLTEPQQRYLNFMEKVKKASLSTISLSIKVDKDTILRDIEPVLLYNGRIKISPRGREYVQD